MMYKSLIASVTFFVFLCQCSATTHKRSMGEVIDDNVIHAKLNAKLIKDKTVEADDVKIKVWKGMITLTGTVDNQKQIDRAIEISEQQLGVTEVKAYLALKSSDQTGQHAQVKKKTVIEENIMEPKTEKNVKSQEGKKADYNEFDF